MRQTAGDSEVYCWRRSGIFQRMRALVWRARKPLPCVLRSSAALAPCSPGLERRRATVPEHRLPVLGLSLRPYWTSPSLLCSISLLFLLVRVALKVRSHRFHSPRLCRIAVLLIQTIVSLPHHVITVQ